MEVPRGTRKVINSSENKPRLTIREKVKKGLRHAVIGLGLGAAAFGAYELGREKNEGPKKPVTGIERTIKDHKQKEIKSSEAIDGVEINEKRKRISVEVDGQKFVLLGRPQNENQKEFLKSIFKKVNPERMNLLLENSKLNGVINKNERLENGEDFFYMIWNIYREINNEIHYTPKLIMDLEAVEDGIEELKSQRKILGHSKEKNRESLRRVGLEIKNLEAKQRSLLEEKSNEHKEKSILKKAERLAVMLTVLDRCLHASFPQSITSNILKEKAFSWTFEKKYPTLPKETGNAKLSDKKFELIDFNALVDIGALVSELLVNKTPLEAKKLIRSKIAILLDIKEKEIPASIITYHTASLVPQDGKFSEFAMKITSEATRKRLHKTNTLARSGSIDSIKIGDHIFYESED